MFTLAIAFFPFRLIFRWAKWYGNLCWKYDSWMIQTCIHSHNLICLLLMQLIRRQKCVVFQDHFIKHNFFRFIHFPLVFALNLIYHSTWSKRFILLSTKIIYFNLSQWKEKRVENSAFHPYFVLSFSFKADQNAKHSNGFVNKMWEFN